MSGFSLATCRSRAPAGTVAVVFLLLGAFTGSAHGSPKRESFESANAVAELESAFDRLAHHEARRAARVRERLQRIGDPTVRPGDRTRDEVLAMRVLAEIASHMAALTEDYEADLAALGIDRLMTPTGLSRPGAMARAADALERMRAVISRHRAPAMRVDRTILQLIDASGLSDPWASEITGSAVAVYLATQEQREANWRLEREVVDALERQLAVLRYGSGWTARADTFVFESRADLDRFGAAWARIDEILVEQEVLRAAMARITQAQLEHFDNASGRGI